MTTRQKILKAFYPIFSRLNKLFSGHSAIKNNVAMTEPKISFYSLKAIANDGNEIDFEKFKGKKILLVNTASDCGFTPQYEELQTLYEKYNDKLIVIGFPANDFKEQEKGSNEEIAAFCNINYGITFQLAKKSVVLKNENQNKVFQWLSDKNKNGWNDRPPAWNFSKYLVSENGILLHYFDPSVSPTSKEVITAVTG